MKATLLSLAALLLCVYAGLCIWLYLFQRSFIYFPVPAVSGAPAEGLWIASDAAHLRVWRLHADRRDAIVYFGGNAEDVSLNIREFDEWFPAHAVYLVNYRGYGGSTGSPTEARLYRDAEAVFDLVNDKHAAVIAMGRSLGSAVAVHLAAVRDPTGLVLITPFDSFASLARAFYPLFPTSLLLKDQYDSKSRANRISVPVLMVVAEDDEIVSTASSESLASAIDPALLSFRVIEDTSHNSIGLSPEYGRSLREFMRAASAGAPDGSGKRPGAAEPEAL